MKKTKKNKKNRKKQKKDNQTIEGLTYKKVFFYVFFLIFRWHNFCYFSGDTLCSSVKTWYQSPSTLFSPMNIRCLRKNSKNCVIWKSSKNENVCMIILIEKKQKYQKNEKKKEIFLFHVFKIESFWRHFLCFFLYFWGLLFNSVLSTSS